MYFISQLFYGGTDLYNETIYVFPLETAIELLLNYFFTLRSHFSQLAVLWSRRRTFWQEPEPVKKLRLQAVAVGLRIYVVAKLKQFLYCKFRQMLTIFTQI